MASVKPDDLMGTDVKGTTAADAIAQVRNALKELVGPEGLGILPSLPTNLSTDASSGTNKGAEPQDYQTIFKEADLHALSRVPLASSRRKLNNALEALRGAAAARESWDADKADRLLRVKQDTIAKQCAIRTSKTAAAECRRLAITEDPFATPVSLAIQRLRAVADATGATTAEDIVENVVIEGEKPTPTKRKDRLLTVCGTKFLADFHFFDTASQQINVKVKFRRLTADDSEVGDDDVDENFAELIRKEQFPSLQRAFEKLIAEERLSAAITQEISLIDAMRCFEDDLLGAQRAEKKDGLPEEDYARVGHGTIKRSALGLSIVFMKDHNAYLGVEDAHPARNITVERTLVAQQDVLVGQVPPVGNVSFVDGKLATVEAQYVLQLTMPIIVCLTVAQRLETVGRGSTASVDEKTGMYGAKIAARDLFSSRSDTRQEDGFGKSYHWPSLQKLLAPAVFASQERTELEGQNADPKAEVTHAPPKEIVKRLDHWSQTSTEFVAAAELPEDQYIEFSHSGNDAVAGLVIHRIPLCHPRNVLPIFGLLRQQIVFNELFQSCFQAPIYPDASKTAIQPQPVEVVTCDAPSFMLLNLHDKTSDDMLSMGVTIQLGGDISVKLKTSSDQPHACSNAKASAIIRESKSIPLSIMSILKMGDATAQHRA